MPPLFLMTDDLRLPDPLAVARTMPCEWGIVFRHYASPRRRQLAQELAIICAARGVVLLVAADWRLACEVGADGIHMPERALRTGLASQVLTACRARYLTVSAHGPTGLRLAKSMQADGVFLSPVKRTASHADVAPLGVLRFAALAQTCRVPVYALGGLDYEDAPRLSALGAAGIAGVGLAGI